MEFSEARRLLVRGYQSANLSPTELLDDRIELDWAGERVAISREEIIGFGANRDRLIEATTAPVECSLCSPTYREQLAAPIDPLRFLGAGPMRSWEFFTDGDQAAVVIGPASDLFIDYFRFDNNYLQLCRTRGRFPPREVNTLRDLLFRPLTVQVHCLDEASVTAAILRSDPLIDSCLFSLAYLKQRPLRLQAEWPTTRRLVRRRPFSYLPGEPVRRLSLPRVKFDADVLRFYQLGVATEVPELQFIAYYQVLEFYFLAVADEALYANLQKRIGDPAFTPAPRHLDKLIKEVVNHTSKDETDMLKAVVSRYVAEDDLVEFIRSYEHHLGEPYYTRKRARFGTELEVKLQHGHVIGNVSAIVRTVRNALVHSSDRFERSGRHVPFSPSSQMVEFEVPLVKFLAEKVIIANGRAIDATPM